MRSDGGMEQQMAMESSEQQTKFACRCMRRQEEESSGGRCQRRWREEGGRCDDARHITIMQRHVAAGGIGSCERAIACSGRYCVNLELVGAAAREDGREQWGTRCSFQSSQASECWQHCEMCFGRLPVLLFRCPRGKQMEGRPQAAADTPFECCAEV